jgi:hypothetical protein
VLLATEPSSLTGTGAFYLGGPLCKFPLVEWVKEAYKRRCSLTMKILVLGSGLMGPAAAFNAMSDPDVSQVVVCDLSQRQLDACVSKLAGMKGVEKPSAVLLDLSDQATASRFMADFDAAIGALPRSAKELRCE